MMIAMHSIETEVEIVQVEISEVGIEVMKPIKKKRKIQDSDLLNVDKSCHS